jgi:hypothetical protein
VPKKPPQLAFSYPRRGLTGYFNTFRLGVAVLKDCQPGRVVELVDARSKKVLGRAKVIEAHVGHLTEMAFRHIAYAHNWRDQVPRAAPADLIASMKKRYPPGRVRDDSVVTVLYLEEISDAPPVSGL